MSNVSNVIIYTGHELTHLLSHKNHHIKLIQNNMATKKLIKEIAKCFHLT